MKIGTVRFHVKYNGILIKVFNFQWRTCKCVRKTKSDGKEVLVVCSIGQFYFHTSISQFGCVAPPHPTPPVLLVEIIHFVKLICIVLKNSVKVSNPFIYSSVTILLLFQAVGFFLVCNV